MAALFVAVVAAVLELDVLFPLDDNDGEVASTCAVPSDGDANGVHREAAEGDNGCRGRPASSHLLTTRDEEVGDADEEVGDEDDEDCRELGDGNSPR